MNGYRDLRVALLGCGSVGAQVARLILEQGDELAARVGARLQLAGIAVRSLDAKRDVELPQELFTTDAEQLVLGADVVVELMGGVEPARTLILQALEAGADVVTANKALIAAHGPELADAAEQVGAQLSYEAAVAGAIPIIRPLRESLAGDHITRVLGIVNGSTNYILDRMDRFGDSAEDAMRVASELGYLEADPTLDVEGYDAAQKATILASIAFHTEVPVDAVHREGITSITSEQIQAARNAGAVIKLLAIAERVTATDGTQGVSARVYPALIDRDHPLAAVHGGKNAVFVEAEAAGELMFYGAGAGGVETASAVLGDLVSAARRHVVGGPGIPGSAHADLPILSVGEVRTRYQVMLDVRDEPGVLAAIAGILADHGVSAASVEQSVPEDAAGTATLVIGTHTAREADLAATVDALRDSDVVTAVTSVLRLEGN
ncbi:homoserine dehydrogenase [Leucobacter sp. OLJS4]|uniref:homoserine dehydrogenase n=1 Tax=unclassified Leucobacter TaxID=2621730 RepID=UPI000C17CEDD|nr:MULTISPECIES: homoserine dehydrogenase [unclassified Leucobacter]PIJ55238.1 homoserine dehydrogenase [Leucobacter sp. OLES1]PII82878.1 homoserine dehydrogenase [Leucobacter sp. OLCALW19]PII88014.1 homoserine dehydrogenase [Leucobacter sp. OLTLW20]PII91872.1 homoserine dehydrogenase [Leucobacter sp. OLAS13]PII99487.1 homoserine dehydrogenase [Leucobacter sp. OLCS4]